MNFDRAGSKDYDRVYLALLCQCPAGERRRAELEDLLARHRWHSEDHRVVFEALAGWRAEPETIRDGLAARITRRGFPDIEIEAYFAPVAASLETALRRLRAELAAEPNHSAAPSDRSVRDRDAAESDRTPLNCGAAPSGRSPSKRNAAARDRARR